MWALWRCGFVLSKMRSHCRSACCVGNRKGNKYAVGTPVWEAAADRNHFLKCPCPDPWNLWICYIPWPKAPCRCSQSYGLENREIVLACWNGSNFNLPNPQELLKAESFLWQKEESKRHKAWERLDFLLLKGATWKPIEGAECCQQSEGNWK